MKIKLTFICLWVLAISTSVNAQVPARAAQNVLARLLPGQQKNFVFKQIRPDSGRDVYRIYSTGDGKIHIEGNTAVSMSTGLYYYLRKYCNVSTSWTGDQLHMPATLPKVEHPIRTVSAYEHRFTYNYCTFSYSMAFWDWKRWEKELDWMALHGVNLSLAIVGQEAVWQNTLKHFGYTDAEIKQFICGPAFNAWWLMGNLEGWGGPTTQSWIDAQAQLQTRIVKRMKELGIQPVLQGFYGMVPNSMIKKYPEAKFQNTGKWLGFQRPAILLPSDSLFAKMAATYYHEQEKLYGKSTYFQGDPFHEGGNTKGLDLTAVAKGIYGAMTAYQPNAIWVLQAWQNNPRAELLKGIPIGKALVTDLNAEARPQYGGVQSSVWYRKNGFDGHDWMFTEIHNFGGRTGMTAKLDETNTRINAARNSRFGKTMKGIGVAPEAIGQDAVLYDLLFDMAWRTDTVNMNQWLTDYVKSRYGKFDADAFRSWQILRQTVYGSTYEADGPYESILTTRPGWNRTKTSSWGYDKLDYSAPKLVVAWDLALKSIPHLQQADAFKYDLVNLTRQVLDNHGHILYKKMQAAYEQKDKQLFSKLSNQFLDLIMDQNRLLSSRSEFMVGPWIAQAKSRGVTDAEKKFYEWNARTLITTWTHELNDVNDYSYREWSGLLSDYYYPRWQLFLNDINQNWYNKPLLKPAAFFEGEKQWTMRRNLYPTKPTTNAIAEVLRIENKYGKELRDEK